MVDPGQGINRAIAAYLEAARGKAPGMEPRDETRAGESFGDLVQGAIRQSIEQGKTSERQSLAAVDGRADMTRVVTAVAEAELTLQTVVAVRDKVLEAYHDILRMPI